MGKKVNKWALVVGARPNFMKIAPLVKAIEAYNKAALEDHLIEFFLVHTGQHYDVNMSDSFFTSLELPEPDMYLNVGSGTHAEQTGKVLIAFEKILFDQKPNLVIVVGDVNSTMACTLAAAKLNIPVAHIEAGLRSRDRTMPEEINRIVTDALSSYLLTPSSDGDANLLMEGVPKDKIFLVGNIMIDSLVSSLKKARNQNILQELGLRNGNKGSQAADYALLTLHRPSNVDHKPTLTQLLEGLIEISSSLPIIFPMHPRTRKQITEFQMEHYFEYHDTLSLSSDDYYENDRLKQKIHCLEPLGYLDFLCLTMNARLVLTDSGGIQEETTYLGIPCITLRENTERPVTVTEGTNVIVGNSRDKMVQTAKRFLTEKNTVPPNPPQKWDGRTAERIVQILIKKT